MIPLNLHEDASASTFPITDSELEIIHCPVCKNPEFHIIHIFTPFNVVMCNECELAYLNPRVKEAAILDLYQMIAHKVGIILPWKLAMKPQTMLDLTAEAAHG